MHEVLKDCPEILAQMYLTEDCYNHIPTDRISYKEDFSEFIEIISALKDQPNVISEILEYYPEGDINKAWRQDKGWYDVRTGKPLSSKQQEIIDRRKGHFSIVNKEVPFETVSTIVYLLKDSPETLLKLLSNITFFIDINNHAQVLNLFKETAPEVLADMYLNGKVSWAKPGEYEKYYPSTYSVSEPKIENVPLTESQKNEIINDIIELALDSDLSALKSKKLLNEYCRHIPNYNIIIKQLEELEIEELIMQEKSNKN